MSIVGSQVTNCAEVRANYEYTSTELRVYEHRMTSIRASNDEYTSTCSCSTGSVFFKYTSNKHMQSLLEHSVIWRIFC